MLDTTFTDTWNTRKSKLNKISYTEYLNSDEWSAIKRKALGRDRYKKCYVCGSKHNIELHHMSYNTIGTTDLRNIRALCRNHHQEIHDFAKKYNISVRLATRKYRKIFLKHLKG